MNTETSPPRVRYHLRASILAGAGLHEDEALLDTVRAGQFDEVMFFLPHAEDNSPGLGTLDECYAAAGRVAPLFDQLRDEGIVPSVNVWWTLSFSDFPGCVRDLRDRFAFRWAVGASGLTSRSVSCPSDPVWQEHVCQMYRIFSALEPAKIWVDDDLRMTLRADLHSPCFCDACLDEMQRRTGKTLSREGLLGNILADPPNQVRNAWLTFQHDLALSLLRMIRDTVAEVSPETQVCLMHSNFEIHAAEGRHWEDIVEVLGGSRPYLRPGIGPYIDTTAPGIVEAFNNTRLCQSAYPAGTGIAPEIENYPHSHFTKSAALVLADLVLAQLLGITEMTFSVNRFTGRLDLELQRERTWEAMAVLNKPYLQAIADLRISHEQCQGVSLYFHEDACRHARGVADQSRPVFLYRDRPWDTALTLMGIATRYGTGDVTAFAGEQICCLSDDDLSDIFSRGVLLDARAAESLLLMGRGDLIGACRRVADAPAVQEIIDDPSFGGLAGDPISLRWEGAPWQFAWDPAARAVSHVVDFARRVKGHGVVLYQNTLGGRVAVFPFDSQKRAVASIGASFIPIASASFMCWPRQAQIRDIVYWLGRKPLPLFVPQAPGVIPLRINQTGRVIVSVTDVSFDSIQHLHLQLATPAFPVSRVRCLRADGRWESLTHIRPMLDQENELMDLSTDLTLHHLDTAILELT